MTKFKQEGYVLVGAAPIITSGGIPNMHVVSGDVFDRWAVHVAPLRPLVGSLTTHMTAECQ